MVKIHTTITIDPDIFSKAKTLNFNISGEFEEFLKMKITQITNSSTEIDILLNKKQLKDVEKHLLKLQIEQKNLIDSIEISYKKGEIKEKERLQKIKEKIEKTRKCAICGEELLVTEKKEILLDGRFVHSSLNKGCYQTALERKLI